MIVSFKFYWFLVIALEFVWETIDCRRFVFVVFVDYGLMIRLLLLYNCIPSYYLFIWYFLCGLI